MLDPGTAGRTFVHEDENRNDHQKDQSKDERVTAQGISCSKQGGGKRTHLCTKLLKYLCKDRQHLYDQNHDHEKHHGYHNKGIGDSTFDTVCNGLLPFIIFGKGSQDIVCISRFFTKGDQLDHIIREKTGFQKCLVEAGAPSAGIADPGKQFLPLRIVGVLF